MGWVAKKRQKIQRGNKVVWVEPGDPIPEAEYWRNRQIWIDSGHIALVGEVPAEVAKKVKVKPKPKPEPESVVQPKVEEAPEFSDESDDDDSPVEDEPTIKLPELKRKKRSNKLEG